MNKQLRIILTVALLAANSRAQDICSEIDTVRMKERVMPGREQVKPLLDVPLKDPSICKGPDGWYYLTGTDGTPVLPEYGKVDFINNDGIRVWRSKDLVQWEFVTQVLDLSLKGMANAGSVSPRGWMRRPTAQLDRADGAWIRGAQAPEIHYLKNTFWIVYSISGVGGGLLKSTTGKPEGPYEDWAFGDKKGGSEQGAKRGRCRLFLKGGSPSLFEDDDGAVYLLWDDGKIARLKDDLSGLAEGPRQLACVNPARTGDAALDYPTRVGMDGYFLKKLKGRYYLFATDRTSRGGETSEDVYVAWSSTVYGPYSERRWAIPHAAQTTVFDGPDGKLMATYCGNDAHAAFRDRAGIVPMGWTTSDHPHKFKPDAAFPRRLHAVNTERYPWHRIKPIAGIPLRDTAACRGENGEVVYTGSHITKNTDGKLYLWRSMDMVNWEQIAIWDWDRQKKLLKDPYIDPRESKKEYVFSYMDTEVWYLNNTYYVGYSLYPGGGNAFVANPQSYILKSTTGKVEGPYEPVYLGSMAQPTFFKDDDGKLYMCDNSGYRLWKPDLSGIMDGAKRNNIFATDGSLYIGDCSGHVNKILGKYVNFSTGAEGPHCFDYSYSEPGSYTWNYQYADSLDGPWSREEVVGPHIGHGGMVQDRFGNWWACSFVNEYSQGQACLSHETPYVYPLDVSMRDGRLRIRMADKFPDYVEKALREREAKEKEKSL